MFLKGKDYLSIWDLAHRWNGVAPDSTDPADLPDDVQYLIHKMVEGYWNNDLRLRKGNGNRIIREPMRILFWNLNFRQEALIRCLFDDEIDQSVLSDTFVRRSELIKLCEKEDLDPPEFWMPKKRELAASPKANVTHRPKDEIVDKAVCQAIAKTYWDIDPQIHPAHMVKAKAIRFYGNAKQYTDPNTVKGWIAEVDPLKDQRKIGRPKETTYLIDLETGVLANPPSD